MNVVGIIAEYNPFHKGHAYQIETVKKQLHADYVVIAMSGNFVQRGAPALMDKFSRTEMALCCGADLVLELPTVFATSSAETFASAGVSLLQGTGVVNHLAFGAESGNIKELALAASILLQNPMEYKTQLQAGLKNGLSFPLARARALEHYFSSNSCACPSEPQTLLASPNNILAIEYLKALSTQAPFILPFLLQRQGNSYHNSTLNGDFCSATAIRSHLAQLEYKPASLAADSHFSNLKPLAASMPQCAYEILQNYACPFLFENDFSTLLHYKILTENAQTLAAYADCSPELANRIQHERDSFASFTQFLSLLKTKNITYTRLSRALLHLILDIHTHDFVQTESPLVPYLRVLGFRKSALPLLNAVKHQGTLPLLTSASAASETLPPDAHRLFAADIRASDIYRLGLTAKGGSSLLNDYRRPIVIV